MHGAPLIMGDYLEDFAQELQVGDVQRIDFESSAKWENVTWLQGIIRTGAVEGPSSVV